MARIRSVLAVVRRTTSRPTGTIIAPPMPMRTRAATSSARLGAAAQPIEATVKTATAVVKIRRAPYRSASHPLIGMRTATDSTYAVIATFTATAGTPKLSPMCGAAGAITVPSMISMNMAPATSSARPRETVPGCSTAACCPLIQPSRSAHRPPHGNRAGPATDRALLQGHRLQRVDDALAEEAVEPGAALARRGREVQTRALRHGLRRRARLVVRRLLQVLLHRGRRHVRLVRVARREVAVL